MNLRRKYESTFKNVNKYKIYSEQEKYRFFLLKWWSQPYIFGYEW